MDAQNRLPSPSVEKPVGRSEEPLADAIHFWEPRRVAYNLALTAVAVIWVVASWPHFRPAFTLSTLLPLSVLALLANFCYCAAYLVDIPMQSSSIGGIWKRRRWI